jgi:hypothetical protein
MSGKLVSAQRIEIGTSTNQDMHELYDLECGIGTDVYVRNIKAYEEVEV